LKKMLWFRYNVSILSIFAVLLLMLTSCNSEKLNNNIKIPVDEKNNNYAEVEPSKSHQNSSDYIDKNASDTPLITPSPQNTDFKDKDTSEADIFPEKKFEEVFFRGAVFENLDIIGEKAAWCNLNSKENIFKDLDNDGNEELILLCETDEAPYTRVLLFAGNEELNLEFVEDLSSYGKVGKIFGFRTVNVYGNGTSQVLLNVSVGGIGQVACIVDYKNEKTSEVIRAGVGTSGVEAYVKDIDSDGVEEIIEETNYTDVQNHVYTTTYKWDGKQFKSTGKWSYYYNDKGFVHPSDPKLVVQNYIENMVLGVPKEETIKLVASENLLDSNFASEFNAELIFYSFDYSIQEKSLSENQATFECENIELSLLKTDGRWIIKNIKKVH